MKTIIDTKSVNIRFAGRNADTVNVHQYNNDSYALSKLNNSLLNVSYSYTFGDTSGTNVPVHVWIHDYSQNPVRQTHAGTVYFSDITSLTSNTQDTQI
jgi:hypothetical protein